ncbi:MAG: hypothetical protein IPH83_13595 [Gammaproteobacteria bacterium]|nr:hypothetical protein [Gammaproteobacteria bacterium]
MYSTALPPMTKDDEAPFRAGFDPARAGVRAECDGGAAITGTRFAGRQFFAGTLTGDYRDYGDYPWRWYLMTTLTQAPAGFPYEAVWCDAGSLAFEDE